MEKVGLHSGQAQVLSTLWMNNGQSQAEISRQLEISPATVNSLVSKLESSKFIKCKECNKDKRLMRVFLTKKGLDIRSEIETQWETLESIILKDFSDTEKVLLLMLLEKVKNNLQTGVSTVT
ncbi:MAG: MarR family winged helix-turn-helix transcriptional regulator [Aridibacter sp.]